MPDAPQDDSTNFQKRRASSSFHFSIGGLLLVTTWVSACLGMIVALPGLGLIFSLISLPPLIRTILVVHKKKTIQSVPRWTLVGMYLDSLIVTIIIVVVTLACVGGVFFGVCIAETTVRSAITGRGTLPGPLVVFVSGGLAFLAGCMIVWIFANWVRQRWVRDTTINQDDENRLEHHE